jgi:glycogen operon protein
MVRELHGAGLEVILDVVYNHTAEGNHLGPTLCFRGIDNPAWYRLTPEDPRLYDNWTGTGNTLNMASPEALTLVMDSLRYWVEEMHVDGFRFDLATVLGRTHMNFDPLGGFFGAAVQDPVLRDVKLIAEPWDVGPAGYRVSGFPARFAEWNDRYRDAVRDMWRGAGGVLGEFAHRITGSSDFYERAGRKPTAGVNFVTSHDGFTMADLVSYDVRRNHANGEDNADGHGDNRSWNSGTEGPTTDPGINRLRIDRTRAMLATLMLSQGIPMLLGGDEIRRSQGGNNNAYNQDNEISWYDWSRPDEELYGFVRSLIRLRREHPTFRRTMWLHEDVDSATDRVAWFTPVGEEMTVDDWHDPAARSVALHLPGDVIHASEGLVADDDFYLAINATERAESFSIPALLGPEPWIIEVDSADPPRAGQEVGGTFPVDRFSLLVVRRPWAPPGDRSPGIGVAGSG